MSAFNVDEVNRLIAKRRSIFPKMFSGEIVEDAVIRKMLENANWAPTHRFTEPWRFHVFKGEGIQRLAKFQSDLYRERATREEFYDAGRYEKLLTKPSLCSHIISIGMHRDDKEEVPEMEEIAAVAMAVQNMYLTATAYEVGCYWGTGSITFFDEAKPFFDLGPNDKLLGFLYVGKPKSEIKLQGRRGAVEEKTSWIVS